MQSPRFREQRASYWKAVLDDQAQSGMTQTAFCRAKGISLHSFRAWRYRENARLRTPAAAITIAGHAASRFVPVAIRPEPTSQPAAAIEIQLLHGYRVAVGSQFDPAALAKILDLLELRAC